MDEKRILSKRLIMLVLWMLIWVIVWNSIFAVATNQFLIGVLGGVVGVALIGVAVEGSVIRRLEGREIPNLSLIMIGLIIAVLVYGEIRDLMINDLQLLGEFYLPGLLALVRIVGSFVFSALLAWEAISVIRQPSH